MGQWLIHFDGKQYSADNLDQIRQWLSEGRIPSRAHIYHPSFKDWVNVSVYVDSLPEIKGAGETIPTLARDKVPTTAGLAALVDVETTGLSPRIDRIVEFAGVLFAFERTNGRVLGVVYGYSSLNDPGCTIPKGATKVHGITDQMVKGKRLDPRMVDSLLQEAEFVVAHNSSFDSGFLSRVGSQTKSKNWLCSMRGIAWRANGYSSYGLQALLAEHGIKPKAAHRAMDDVRCTLQLLATDGGDGRTYLWQLIAGDRKRRQEREPTPQARGSSERVHHRQGQGEVFNAWTTGGLARMLEATKCQSHPIDRHFLLLQIVSATYKQRKDPVHRRLLYEYAAIHVQEFETLAPLLRAEFGGKLPVVPTVQYLATTLTEDKRFDEAIEACEFALRHGLIDGTKSGFEGRISRINKKRAKG